MSLRNASDHQGSVLCEMDALTLRTCVISSELFGVGLQVCLLSTLLKCNTTNPWVQVSTEVPHIVQNVVQVVYADSQYQNGERHCIQPGDQLVGVAGSIVQSVSVFCCSKLFYL
jgi:hypothetical protein